MKRTRRRSLIRLSFAVAVAVQTAFVAAMVAAPVKAAGGSAGGLAVSVAYAEDKETNNPNPAAFPVTWQGSPNIVFLGGPVVGQTQCGTLPTCFDAGAIRLDNPTPADILVSDVSVDVHSALPGGKVFDLWGSFTVPAGKSVILTENPPGDPATSDDFDTSGFPGNQCTPIAIAPTVTVAIGAARTTLADTGHVLDTGGIDVGYCPSAAKNESLAWRPIGAAGSTTATLSLAPGMATQPVGGTILETATLLDGGGIGLANVPVAFRVASGPNAGQTGLAITDSGGRATFRYTDTVAGTDIVAASVSSIGTFTTQAIATWGSGTTPTWTGQDIGSPPLAGGDSLAGGVWTVSGSGRDIGGTADQFHFVSQPIAGDGDISARVASQTNSNSRARAGVMLRQSADPAAPFYAAVVTPGAGVWILERASQGGSVVTLATVPGLVPVYLRVDRTGFAVTSSTSADGSSWTTIPGSAAGFAISGALLAGLAVTSHTATKLSTATFDSVDLSASPTPTPTPTATPAPSATPQPSAPTPTPTAVATATPTGSGGLPAPWADTDVGGPVPAGSATYAGGVFDVNGSGADIFGTSDQFNYVYQPTTGDGTIVARVISQSTTGSSNTKAGVIWKASTAASSPYILIAVAPSGLIKVQYNFSGSVTGQTLAFPNVWMKLVRSGSLFSAYVSPDGVAWTPVVLAKSLPTMPVSATVGVFECSHKAGTFGTAAFDNLAFNPGP